MSEIQGSQPSTSDEHVEGTVTGIVFRDIDGKEYRGALAGVARGRRNAAQKVRKHEGGAVRRGVAALGIAVAAYLEHKTGIGMEGGDIVTSAIAGGFGVSASIDVYQAHKAHQEEMMYAGVLLTHELSDDPHLQFAQQEPPAPAS